MRPCVVQFLTAAVESLDLVGPFGLVGTRPASAEAAEWMRREFADELVIDCRVPDRSSEDAEIEFGPLPIDDGALGAVLCLDLLRRFDETRAFLHLATSLVAPGGMVLVTADVGDARPRETASRVLTPLGLERLVADLDAAIVGWQGDVDFPSNLFLVVGRPPVARDFAEAAGQFLEAFRKYGAAAQAQRSWLAKVWSSLRPWRVDRAAELTGPTEVRSFSLHFPEESDWKRALFDWEPPKRTHGPRYDRN